MKYAFILGSNSYITPHGIITYTHGGETKQFLSVRSYQIDSAEGLHLSVDLDISDMHDGHLKLTDNQLQDGVGFHIDQQRDRILINKLNGDTIIDIHQLDDKTAMSLEHNIVGELEALNPVAIIRVRGNFMLGGMHVEIDNEKLFINGNGYANSTLASQANLQFEEAGVVF